jgi:hypothetical protein
MNGAHNMTADTIKKTEHSLFERGLPDHSFFEVEFEDGSIAHEKEFNWSDMSEQVRVKYFDQHKTVMLSTLPVKKITLSHDGMNETVEIPEGYRVYQAVRAMTAFQMDGSRMSEIVGRVVGLVKDGGVIEERFLNGIESKTYGTRE